METNVKCIAACLLLVLFVVTWGQPVEAGKIDWTELNGSVQVIGALGCPLGQAVVLEGTIVSGRVLGMKELKSDYLIRVEKVDGKELAKPPVMTFHIPSFVGLALAEDEASLFRLKSGKQTNSHTDKEIRKMEKGYVGSRVRLLSYEEGWFSGIPKNLPRNRLIWQAHGFCFSTRLVLLGDESGPVKR